jgi:hypothetical protein
MGMERRCSSRRGRRRRRRCFGTALGCLQRTEHCANWHA